MEELPTKLKLLAAAADENGLVCEINNTPGSRAVLLQNDCLCHKITMKSFGLNDSNTIKLSRHKYQLRSFLSKLNLPVPRQAIIETLEQYSQTVESIGFPQVIKKINGQRGESVFMNVDSLKKGTQIVTQLLKKQPALLIEEQVPGYDLRLLFLDKNLIGACSRQPSTIRADGLKTIRSLIESENQRRLKENEQLNRKYTQLIPINLQLEAQLESLGFTLESVPTAGTMIIPIPLSNTSMGGLVQTVPIEEIHPQIIKFGQKTVEECNLRFAGIDLIVSNHKNASHAAKIIEVNTNPSIRIHDTPHQGNDQKVRFKILQSIFQLSP